MTEFKNQHYVPQFYLKGFTRPDAVGQLYVFKKGYSHWAKRGVKSVASEEYLHSYRDANGEMNHEIEKVLGQLEDQFSPVLNKLLRKQELSIDEQYTFACFLAVMWQRVPTEVEHYNQQWTQVFQMVLRMSYRQYSKNPDTLEQSKKAYRDRTGDKGLDNLQSEDLDPAKVNIRANPLATLVSMLEVAPKVAELLFQMGWTFLESEAPNYFITSDHPFCMVDPSNKSKHYGTGLIHENVEISMPLSRNVAFFAGWKSSGRRWLPASGRWIEQINYRTARIATRELIAPSRNFPGVEQIMRGFASKNA